MEKTTTTWYRAVNHRIEPVEVIKVTDKQIVYVANGREYRAAKEGSYDNYFSTRAEAKAHLVELWTNRVKNAENDLEYARAHL
jgi:hypothetical protein